METRTLWARCREDLELRSRIARLRLALGAEGASLLLVSEAEGKLVFCVAEGLNADALEGGGSYDAAVRTDLSPSRGINAIAVLMGKPLCVETIDRRHDPHVDRLLGQKTRSVFAIPLIVSQSCAATLSMINPHAHGPPEKRDRFCDEDRKSAFEAANRVEARVAAIMSGSPP